MTRATITEVKNGLSSYIDRVRAGESIVITDRGIPVAVLEPMSARVDLDDRMARLERAGIIRRGTGEAPARPDPEAWPDGTWRGSQRGGHHHRRAARRTMRFWDTSAIVPLLVTEPASAAATAEFGRDPELLLWWGTGVECTLAFARLEREGRIAPQDVAAAADRLAILAGASGEVRPSERVRVLALRLLRTHVLQAGDAFQLAAAIVGAGESPNGLPFVTLDPRLARAAEREGFPVVEPA